MKVRSQISLIVCCALIQCAGYAFVSDPAQQSARNSTTLHPSTHNKNVISKIPLPTPGSIVKTNRSKMVHNNGNGFKVRSVSAAPRLASIKPAAASKTINHNLPTCPAANSAIGGGNFRNPHLTPIAKGIGGPARTTRNTATLSGTGMGRRRVN